MRDKLYRKWNQLCKYMKMIFVGLSSFILYAHTRESHDFILMKSVRKRVTKIHLQLKKNEVVYVCIFNVYEITKYMYSIRDVLQRDVVILSSFKKYT